MRISHVIPHIDDEAAGPSYSVPRLCQSLSHLGHEVELCCLAANGDIAGVTVDVHSQWPVVRRFAISTSLTLTLYRQAPVLDVVHNHSLWSMVNLAAGWMVAGRGAKLVCSPHGTLSSWALSRNRRLKRLLWPLQCRVLTRADLLHATCETEYRAIRSLGFTAPVAIIPNGIDLPGTGASRRPCESEERRLLYLGRLHPTKSIDRLLQSWSTLQSRHPNWRLVITGKGKPAYVRELTALAKSLRLARVEFTGPLYGEQKSGAYFNAELFVLPSHSENFGMVVAEALAHNCPAVVSRGAPWQGLTAKDCGWWVDSEIPALTEALSSAMSLPGDVLQRMGRNGRAWMQDEFDWATVGAKMEGAYRWLVEGGECPPWIRQD